MIAPAAPVDWSGYPGSKAAAGVAERIAGLLPSHPTYVEAFLGYGAVMRRKRRAAVNIGIDLDPAVIDHWNAAALAGNADAAGVQLICGNAVDRLPTLPAVRDPDAVVYIDAPYLLDARTSGRLLYGCEMTTPEAHTALIGVARALPCRVVVSHYPHHLYDSLLADWRHIDIPARTRGSTRTERVWLNFPEPTTFHDPFLANVGYRERERVKKRGNRWLARLDRLPPAERQYIIDQLRSRLDVPGGEVLPATTGGGITPPQPAVSPGSPANSDDAAGRPDVPGGGRRRVALSPGQVKAMALGRILTAISGGEGPRTE